MNKYPTNEEKDFLKLIAHLNRIAKNNNLKFNYHFSIYFKDDRFLYSLEIEEYNTLDGVFMEVTDGANIHDCTIQADKSLKQHCEDFEFDYVD